jgi:hypothetical protein
MAGRGKKKEKKTQFDIDMAHRAALYNPWREGGGGTPDGTRRRRRENSVLKKERKKKVETFDFSVELVGKRQVSASWPGIGHRMEASNKHIRTRRHGERGLQGATTVHSAFQRWRGPHNTHTPLTRRSRRRKSFFIERNGGERDRNAKTWRAKSKFNMK